MKHCKVEVSEELGRL